MNTPSSSIQYHESLVGSMHGTWFFTKSMSYLPTPIVLYLPWDLNISCMVTMYKVLYSQACTWAAYICKGSICSTCLVVIGSCNVCMLEHLSRLNHAWFTQNVSTHCSLGISIPLIHCSGIQVQQFWSHLYHVVLLTMPLQVTYFQFLHSLQEWELVGSHQFS